MSGFGQNILVVAAHADDEALGCGGSIVRWAAEGRSVHLLILADGESSRGNAAGPAELADKVKRRRVATQAAGKIMGIASIAMLEFPDNCMDKVALLDVVKAVEKAIATTKPECVLTHHYGDVNIDP